MGEAIRDRRHRNIRHAIRADRPSPDHRDQVVGVAVNTEQAVTDWVEQYLQSQLSSRVLLDRRVGLHKAASAGLELGREESQLELFRRKKDISRLQSDVNALRDALLALTVEANSFLLTASGAEFHTLAQKLSAANAVLAKGDAT